MEMKVAEIMNKLTAPNNVLENVYSMLRQVDPAFEGEYASYIVAKKNLEDEFGDTVTPNISSYIQAVEKQIAAEMVYVGWLGFQQNLACFKDPVNALMLRADFEDIHRERRMHTLPNVQEALPIINAFHEAMRAYPQDKRDLSDGITDFICYLETTGYKVVHYFCFLLADELLYHVIPGYTKDTVTTGIYGWGIEKFLKVDLKKLA